MIASGLGDIRAGRKGVMAMPLVELYFGVDELSPEAKADLSRKVTDLIVKEAKVPQEYTWVMIHEVPPQDWMIDRLTLPELFAKLSGK